MSTELNHDLTPDEFRDVSTVVVLSLHLLLLDKAWTREARLASHQDTRDAERVRSTGRLVDDMARTFDELRGLAPRLAELGRRADLQAKVDALLATAGRPGAISHTVAEQLRHHMAEHGGNTTAVLDAATQLISDKASDEIGQIRAEYARLTQSYPSAGDLSAEAEFAVGVASIAATTLLGPEVGLLVEAGAHLLCG